MCEISRVDYIGLDRSEQTVAVDQDQIAPQETK